MEIHFRIIAATIHLLVRTFFPNMLQTFFCDFTGNLKGPFFDSTHARKSIFLVEKKLLKPQSIPETCIRNSSNLDQLKLTVSLRNSAEIVADCKNVFIFRATNHTIAG